METRTGLQDTFLNEARRLRMPLTVFMTNGFQQRGTVVSYDGYTVLLVNENRQYLIYTRDFNHCADAPDRASEAVASVWARRPGGQNEKNHIGHGSRAPSGLHRLPDKP